MSPNPQKNNHPAPPQKPLPKKKKKEKKEKEGTVLRCQVSHNYIFETYPHKIPQRWGGVPQNLSGLATPLCLHHSAPNPLGVLIRETGGPCIHTVGGMR